MERALKERIIGASVLVVVVVLVVPVFLDGPPEDGEVVSRQVSLPGQNAQNTQTVVLDRDRDEPVPAAATMTPTPAPVRETQREAVPADAGGSGGVGSDNVGSDNVGLENTGGNDTGSVENGGEEQAVAAAPARQVTPAESRPDRNTIVAANSTATSTTGMWAVQLGSFSNRENAERLAADLRKQGFAAFLSGLATGSGQLHRVRIGPQKDRDDAEAMAARLKSAGHTGQVVPHP